MTSREWNSAAYDRLSHQQFIWGMKVLERVRVRGGETVLDAGCGSGRLTAEIVRRLPQGHVFAVDLSENMLRMARQNLSDHTSNVSFVCADLQELPFRSHFDGLFSTAAFHWVKDHPRLFRSLFVALKPGGWLVAQCGGGPNLARLRARVAELIASQRYRRYFGDWREPWEFASPEVTADRLRHAGFAEVETWLEAAGFTLPDAETLKEYLATVTLHQHLARIPDPKLREGFLEELARRMEGEAQLELDYWRLNIDARKPERIE
jgi:trans-aconitate methyltransferase